GEFQHGAMERDQGRIAILSLRARWPGLEQASGCSAARTQKKQKPISISRGEYVIITQTTSGSCNHRDDCAVLYPSVRPLSEQRSAIRFRVPKRRLKNTAQS